MFFAGDDVRSGHVPAYRGSWSATLGSMRPANAAVRWCGAIAAAAMAYAAVPAEASTWSPDEAVLAPSSGLGKTSVEVGPRGYAVALLPQAAPRPPSQLPRSVSEGLQIAIRPSADKKFGEPLPLDEQRPASYGFGMSATGESVVAWVDRRGRVLFVRFSPGERPSAPRRLARRVGGRIALSVADDGTAIVVYDRGGRRTFARTALPGSSFGRPELIAHGERARAVVLDAGDGGRGVIA